MAAKLLPEHLTRSIHIALLILFFLQWGDVQAQSVLLPGDVAVVSVNASNNSVDLIPLIDIEKGTEIYLSAGKWDPSEGILTGTEATLFFKTSVQAGSNIHVDGKSSEVFDFSGRLPFVRSQNQFYVYQKEENIYRFIYGVRFGAANIDLASLATDIPPVLSETENTFVQLGAEQNHQYFIRNGASGTQNMLLGFLGDSMNWNDSDSPFSPFGTSFNVLTPPVVMFETTSSSFNEGDTLAALQVTIYEHDGSRVSVDVEFEASQSSADSLDFSELGTKTLNFTGLVGTYTTDIPLQISEDESFEGREGAIFYLNNLTGGTLGDFISHSVAIEDGRVPNLVITDVANGGGERGFIEISNLENSDVSLKNWVLSTDDSKLRIDSSIVLNAYQKIRLFDGEIEQFSNTSIQTFNLKGLNRQLLNDDGGLLSLMNYKERIVHQVGYRRSRSQQNSPLAVDRSRARPENDNALSAPGNTDISSVQSAGKGWAITAISSEVVSELSKQKTLYAWDERTKVFSPINSFDSGNNKDLAVLGIFEAQELDSLNEYKIMTHLRTKENENTPNALNLKLSAIDLNENGSIDGKEGLNLLENSLNSDLRVGAILDMLNEKLDATNSLEVFHMNSDSEGSLYFEALGETGIVPSGSFFWIKLDEEIKPTNFELDVNELLTSGNLISQESPEEISANTGIIELTLKSGSRQQKLELYIDPENKVSSQSDLNVYSELLPKDHFSLIFSAKQGDEFFKSLSIPQNTEQKVSLALNFGSPVNDAYTLSVDKWKNIPADWDLKLVDTYNDKEYDLRVDFSISFDQSFNNDDVKQNSDRFEIQIVPEAANQQAKEVYSDVPKEIELNQNYPNPFNPVTTISFYLPESQDVKLSIFNIVGQPVSVLFEGRLSSGQQQFEWDATDRPSGMYIYQLEVGDKVMTRKMTLVK